MKLPRRRYWVPLLLVVLFAASAWFDVHYHVIGWFRGDEYYRGLPTTYWRNLATYQLKGPSAWQQTFHRWTGIAPPPKLEKVDLFRGNPDADAVLTQLIDDQAVDEQIRLQAIYAFAGPGPRRRILTDDNKATLQRCLNNSKPDIRFAAAHTLLISDEDAATSANVMLEIIRQQLKDASPNERIVGTNRLTILGACHNVDLDTLLPLLRQSQDDSDWRVREAAGRVLDLISERRAKN